MSWIAKAITAAITFVGSVALMVSADVNFADGIDGGEWAFIIAAVVANVGGVYAVPNRPPS